MAFYKNKRNSSNKNLPDDALLVCFFFISAQTNIHIHNIFITRKKIAQTDHQTPCNLLCSQFEWPEMKMCVCVVSIYLYETCVWCVVLCCTAHMVIFKALNNLIYNKRTATSATTTMNTRLNSRTAKPIDLYSHSCVFAASRIVVSFGFSAAAYVYHFFDSFTRRRSMLFGIQFNFQLNSNVR